MRCHRRRRVTEQACRNPLSHSVLRRHGASGCVFARLCRAALRSRAAKPPSEAAPRRCHGIAAVASSGIWPHDASNVTVSTSTTGCLGR